MDENSTESVVLGAVRQAIDDEEAELGRDTLLEDVGVDSIAGYEIRLVIEELCGVKMAQEEFENVRSVGELIDLAGAQSVDPC